MSAAGHFAQLVAGDEVPLAACCFAIADHLGNGDQVEAGRAAMDEITAQVADLAGPAEPDLDAIAAALVGPLRFRGARRTYYDPRNSLLPEVLRRRVGIPITLSIVAIEVAANLGVEACGVGMPGHFLVGEGAVPRRWLDLFDGGTWLDERGARHRFAALHGGDASFDPAFLGPTPPRQIVARVLANLAAVHRAAGDPTMLLRSLELRAAIPGVGRGPRDRVELADAYVGVGRVHDAAAVLDELAQRIDPRRREALAVRQAALRAVLN